MVKSGKVNEKNMENFINSEKERMKIEGIDLSETDETLRKEVIYFLLHEYVMGIIKE